MHISEGRAEDDLDTWVRFFGQPANILPYPAFSGFDPAQFLVRHEIKPDNKDFGPAFGRAWSPGARSDWLGRLLGDGKTVLRGDTRSASTRSLAGIATFQSGTPFTVANGSNRNGIGTKADRPDIGNASAPLTSRALIAPRCATGYQNADAGACVSPNDVHWIEGAGNPNAATVGRNTLRTGGTNNFDLNLSKSIPVGEKRRLELRWEALNAFNYPQFIQVPQTNVNGAPAGWFLNRDFTDGGIRSMWVQVKVVF